MGSFIDKDEVKKAVPLLKAVEMLGIQVQKSGAQYRGKCPLCDSEDERSLVCTPERDLWYSFCCETGGDQIALWQKVKGHDFKDACAEMLGEKMLAGDETVIETMSPLDHLIHDHEAVQVLGFEPDVAEKLGIGYAKKGIMRGVVAVPLRLPDGTLVGYVGITDARLPKSIAC